MTRLPVGGRIDRSAELRFTFDGKPYVGFGGDTLASALLANGVHQLGTSITRGRPRGIMAGGVEEANALIQVEDPFPEPMLLASTVSLVDGLVARSLSGRGELATAPDPARYDRMHHHCDVLVVGAGPAGLVAALTAARSGARVVLLDDQLEVGGSLLSTPGELLGWVGSVVVELESCDDVTVLASTTAFGYYDDGFVLALENLGAGPTRQRVHRVRAKQVIVATGAHERPVVFADNDRPGIMLASAARTYLNRYGVLPGNEIVVFTTNDSTNVVADELAAAGARVTVLDARDGQLVTGTTGTDHVSGVLVGDRHLPCDLLLVSGGWTPTVHLFSQARGVLEYRDDIGAFVPGGTAEGVRVVGAATGNLAGPIDVTPVHEALTELGLTQATMELPTFEAATARSSLVLWCTTPLEHRDHDTRFVDLQRDATVSDILRAVGAGLTSVEHVKRYTTIGTAHDQGKTSGLIASGIVAQALGQSLSTLKPTTFRPPYTSVGFAALAGRDRGAIFDPIRTTTIHGWHVEHGAVFENVGQWLRPWYYPRPGEDLDAAVARETRAARTGVALMDGSTLGKINVQGTDAAEFLDRIYTNLISTIKPGFVRYGVMCGLDGMVIDDGTIMRISETEFVLTTTTGNAALVLDWLEEFAQTEWPDLDVYCTSVTEHWVTIPLVGPQSRAVLDLVAPQLDVSNEAFGFMTWREADVAGIDGRVARVSFSGELAYEINVRAWRGRELWEALMSAGNPYDITPYGTETMHVLRAEKGFPIIGQDTDGTVTPQDLGMSWVVSKKKPDFVGKRSFTRPANLRPDRKHLVGLLPVDPEHRLAEGAQLIEQANAAQLPVPMLGHVTSSYPSVALGRTFALALVNGGRDRIGQTLYAWHDGITQPVTVVDPVLYDKAGKRRDG